MRNQLLPFLLFIAMNATKTDILLIEDNPSDRTLFIKALQKNRITTLVEIAEDGQQALDKLFDKDHPLLPKLIILDLGLPDISGMELLNTIRQNKNTKEIPVVIFTGSNKTSDKINSETLGVNSFITKPVDFYQFTQCVNEISQYWLSINQLRTK